MSYQKREISGASGRSKRLIVCRGDGPQAILLLSSLVNPKTMWAGRIEIPVTLDVPEAAALTIDEYLEVHEEFVTRWMRGGAESPYGQALAEGAFNESLARYELAIESYRRAIALYEEAGRDVASDFDGDESPWGLWLRTVRCLRLMGRLPGALEELDRIEPKLPPMPAGMYRRERDFRSKVIAERMAIAESYLEQGDHQKARRLVDQAESRRPDFRTLSSVDEPFENGFAGSSEATKERYRARARFLPVDRVRYRLEREGPRE